MCMHGHIYTCSHTYDIYLTFIYGSMKICVECASVAFESQKGGKTIHGGTHVDVEQIGVLEVGEVKHGALQGAAPEIGARPLRE